MLSELVHARIKIGFRAKNNKGTYILFEKKDLFEHCTDKNVDFLRAANAIPVLSHYESTPPPPNLPPV